MFGTEHEALAEGLEAIRKRLCQYGPDATTCDCKYGAEFWGEQSGCPELRMAIKLLQGRFEEITYTKELVEASARKTLAQIKRVIERADI